ncbi:MAG: AsnC family transcriptional regulator, partial [Mycobacteriaceae bacterium]|nr:AsnC family transcriptional regulator [Mycobacteriaceae bacterium]
MIRDEESESADLDVLDKQIIHALVTDARVSFAALAGILEVSEQTVARRYRSLRRRGIVHVSGQMNAVPLGVARWVIRLRCLPDRAMQLAESLARFPDLSWVTLLSTGSEVTCVSRPRTAERRDALLLSTLPRASQVTGMVAHEVMCHFPAADEWPRFGELLTEQQRAALGPPRQRRGFAADAAVELTREDERMLSILARDGRAPYARIAAAVGWSPARVARRMAELAAGGVLYFDLDFATTRMGFAVKGALWLRVRPGSLDAVGRAMATHPEIAFVAATTGPTN